jgi:hypothetical protein
MMKLVGANSAEPPVVFNLLRVAKKSNGTSKKLLPPLYDTGIWSACLALETVFCYTSRSIRNALG